jgi:hypothetical protein
MEHLRPHPTELPEIENIRKKFEFKGQTDEFLFAFNPTNYCDIEIFNITGEKTIAYKGLVNALRYSEIPVVFFLCYDVGENETLGVFVRHVVCCLAKGRFIYFFDMRNLSEISKNMKTHIENEIYKLCKVRYEIINLSCNHTPKCRYLQRFKGDSEMGWCIGWALLFLDYITKNPNIHKKTDKEIRRQFAVLYNEIDAQLINDNANTFIETYYIRIMGY